MTLARRTFLASATAAVAAPALFRASRADAAPLVLKLHHALSSVSSAHDRFLVPWARAIEAQSSGRIRIDLFPSMELGGQPAQLYDQARDGLVDIVWAVPAQTPGRFPGIEAFELPFVPSARALVNSKALQDLAAVHLKDEFSEVHPLCFSCADRGIIHAMRPVLTVADVDGLKLHVQTRLAAAAVQALGGEAVQMPSAQLPVAITQHVVDGCIDPWDMVPSLRLSDLLKSHTDFAESSLSTMTYVLAMNKASYDRLPADLRAVIDANSGQTAAGLAGAMWDLQATAVADKVASGGDTITTLLPAAVAHWRKATEPVIVAWLKEMKERKIDGSKLLGNVRVLLAKYADEPVPQPPQPPQPPQASQSAPMPQPSQPPQVSQSAPTPPPTAPQAQPPHASVNAPVAPRAAAAPVAKPAAASVAKPAAAAAKPAAAPASPPVPSVPPASAPPPATASAAPGVHAPPPPLAPKPPAAVPVRKALDIPL